MRRKGLPKKWFTWAVKHRKSMGASKAFKEAWKRSRRKGATTRKASPSRSNPKRRRKTLARRKKRRRSRSITIPIAPIAGLAAGMAIPIRLLMEADFINASNVLIENYTGMRGALTGPPHFDPAMLQRGLLPLIMGLLVHKFVGGSPLNLNRTLARANVPFIRI